MSPLIWWVGFMFLYMLIVHALTPPEERRCGIVGPAAGAFSLITLMVVFL